VTEPLPQPDNLQAKEDDPYRDAEPGKILHELRDNELAHFKLIPHTPYSGATITESLFLGGATE
jgi:hypothetical protein